MSTLRKRKPQETNNNTNPNEINNNEHLESPKISVYEQTREERIKENLERMQKLGLMDLSLKLKACTAPPKRTPRTSPSSTKHPTPFLPRGPLRRSSRLQNSTPVSYSEVALTKKDGLFEDENITQEVGSKPEIYTEEHEKLLGKH
ncbi:ZINC-FINGER DOMAIN OF MONOAMINE-OXIDASE A REPRESSOR R1 [Salix purpurea]|uniref:ZINC-FINGER DOMAIN OF MONOAMINE-OXIDASE A REPRESSOR R1 n=1 Tax=Salix purpurea TaxID=77065 RepID=A0A9Q0ZMS7_SALPP|nr:ZINC-FINGER DOMAIN OF MONOAMINE-OXIDASE A REPRESSOR R1 [Salix purpurea]